MRRPNYSAYRSCDVLHNCSSVRDRFLSARGLCLRDNHLSIKLHLLFMESYALGAFPRRDRVKLLIQPDDGIKPILEALRKAKKSIRILIFRFDRVEIEKALVDAAGAASPCRRSSPTPTRAKKRICAGSRCGCSRRASPSRARPTIWSAITARCSSSTTRLLYLLGFNFTHMDIDLSRSFGVAITKASLVKEAIRLFECDSRRQTYTNAVKTIWSSAPSMHASGSPNSSRAQRSSC